MSRPIPPASDARIAAMAAQVASEAITPTPSADDIHPDILPPLWRVDELMLATRRMPAADRARFRAAVSHRLAVLARSITEDE